MNIRWTELAVLDLENIRDFITRDSEYYAVEFTAKIIDAVEKLYLLPSMGRKVPETFGSIFRRKTCASAGTGMQLKASV